MADIAIFDIFFLKWHFFKKFYHPDTDQVHLVMILCTFMKKADPILAAGAHYKKLPGPYILPIFFENFFNLSIRSEGFVYKTVWHRLSPMPSQGLMKISERSNTRSAFNSRLTKNALLSLSTKNAFLISNMRDSDSCAMEIIPLIPIV